jgi:hypothetical protein
MSLRYTPLTCVNWTDYTFNWICKVHLSAAGCAQCQPTWCDCDPIRGIVITFGEDNPICCVIFVECIKDSTALHCCLEQELVLLAVCLQAYSLHNRVLDALILHEGMQWVYWLVFWLQKLIAITVKNVWMINEALHKKWQPD